MTSISNYFTDITKRNLFIFLILQILVAIFSIGFLHPDEQYFVIDFTFDKLGLIDNYERSWEYLSKIRSYTLPAIFYGLTFPFKSIGLSNPHTLSTSLRITSALVAFITQLYFYKAVISKYFKQNNENLLCFLFLAWPLLLMHARTNTENWSTSLFLLCLGLLLNKKNNLLIGLILGITFYIRFQTAFLMLPLILLYRKNFFGFAYLSLGFFLSLIPLIGIDYWGYGEFVITPFNYFKVNIFEGKVNTFGTSSVFYYGYKTLTKLVPLWGAGVIFALFYALKNIKKDIIYRDSLILLLPFLLIHHLIGHKELRFIYSALPILIILLYKIISSWDKKYLKIFMILNFLAYPILFIPIYKPIGIYKYIYNKEIKKLHYVSTNNPFEIKSLLPRNIEIKKINNNEKIDYIFTQNYKEFKAIDKFFKGCSPKASTYPLPLIRMNPFNILSKSNIWVIFKCI